MCGKVAKISPNFVFLKILRFVWSNDREVVIEFSFLIFRVEILQKFATKNQNATNVILWQTFRFCSFDNQIFNDVVLI
jgi:hypothetical protein